MSKSIQQLRDQLKIKVSQTRKLLDDHQGPAWGAEQQSTYDALVSDIDACEKEIERYQSVLKFDASDMVNVLADRKADELGISKDEAGHDITQEQATFKAWLQRGERGLDEEQLKAQASRNALSKQIFGAQSIGTDTEGGYLAPDIAGDRLLVAANAFGGMREAADVQSTSDGNTMLWPTTDETGDTGELLSENIAAGDDDLVFGVVQIEAYVYSSKVITVPNQLLQDDKYDLIGHVSGRLGRRIGKITNTHFTTGDAANKPEGIVPASGEGKVGLAGQTASVIYDDLVDLEHAVDPEHRKNPGVRWMFHDDTLKILKKLKDADGRPIWVPGITSSEPATILGYEYIINQSMPVMAASAKSILFGDFKQYLIRDVNQVHVMRFTDSAYAKKNQTGFLALARSDGKLIAANNDPIQHYKNAAA